MRLIWPVVWALFVDAADQPAARNPGALRTALLTLIRRSPIPSLIVERYDDRNCQMVKLDFQLVHATVTVQGEEGLARDSPQSQRPTYSSL